MSRVKELTMLLAWEFGLPVAVCLALVGLVIAMVMVPVKVGEGLTTAFPWSDRSITVLRVDRVSNMVGGTPTHYNVSELDAGAATGERQGFVGACDQRFMLRPDVLKVGACYEAEVMGRGRCLVQFSEVVCADFGLREAR